MDSADRRSKRQKLRDMANQADSPHEAEIAKKKLEELGPEEEPIIRSSTVIFFRAGTYVNMEHSEYTTINIDPSWFQQFYKPPFTSGFGEY